MEREKGLVSVHSGPGACLCLSQLPAFRSVANPDGRLDYHMTQPLTAGREDWSQTLKNSDACAEEFRFYSRIHGGWWWSIWSFAKQFGSWYEVGLAPGGFMEILQNSQGSPGPGERWWSMTKGGDSDNEITGPGAARRGEYLRQSLLPTCTPQPTRKALIPCSPSIFLRLARSDRAPPLGISPPTNSERHRFHFT